MHYAIDFMTLLHSEKSQHPFRQLKNLRYIEITNQNLNRMKTFCPLFLITFCLMMTSTPTFSQTETPVTIRVLSHDAKFIGTSMGGVEIMIRDISTGETLASGTTSGGTGDTDLLVLNKKSRYGEISTPESAAFRAILSLTKPVFAEIKASFRTPYAGHPIVQSQTQWLIPGKEMTGDGIILEMPGFATRILHPLPHQAITSREDAYIDFFMIMLCGCPISSGGTWDSDPMDVEALIYEGEELLRSIPLKNYKTDYFRADLTNLAPGSYTVYVTAYDPRSNNTGVEKVTVTIDYE